MPKIIKKKPAITFDDVLLLPSKSAVLPKEADVRTKLSKNIRLNAPLISAAMDTVTESKLAIAMAKEGGVGIIHRNMSIEVQCEEVRKVKRYESWIIRDPVTLSPEDNLSKALEFVAKFGIKSFLVVSGSGKLIGILTQRDMKFRPSSDKIKDLMTKTPVTARNGISIEKATEILVKNKIEKLPLIDSAGRLKGLITINDIEKSKEFPNACKDKEGRLLVGAAVSPSDPKRAEALVKAGADVLVVDTAHGHSLNVIRGARDIKKSLGIEVIAGNIVTGEAAEDLIAAGVDGVKVGVGPGSICTTRIVAGVGMPQISAIQECAEAAEKYKVSVISDGGIRYSGDVAKAIAAGAHCVMIGSIFAGTEESPGRIVFMNGRKYKKYRGMGSMSAMVEGSKDRYFQDHLTKSKLVPEGVEGVIPYRGTVSEIIYQFVGGLKSAMGYCGCKTIDEMRKKARFIRITQAGRTENHPHDIMITEDAPNYWR
jgi:IMP dehydrogenase